MRTFELREILKCIRLKFTVYGCKQTDRHTHAHAQCSPASVGLAQVILISVLSIFITYYKWQILASYPGSFS